MYTIKRLNELKFDEAVAIWNEGFKGYFFDATMTVDAFVARIVKENLSISKSIVAYDGEKPVGILLNGIQEINNQKISWNGGTGVIPEYRNKGVGRFLVKSSIEIYKEEGVNLSTLEAISQNTPAIELYKKMGYEIIDNLVWLQNQEPFEISVNDSGLKVSTRLVQDIQSLEIYDKDIKPWQSEWINIRQDGELATVVDPIDGKEIAYFLFRRGLNSQGELSAIVLYQAKVMDDRKDTEEIIKVALNSIFSPELNIKRVTANFPTKNKAVVKILDELGFTPITEQVFMTLPLGE